MSILRNSKLQDLPNYIQANLPIHSLPQEGHQGAWCYLCLFNFLGKFGDLVGRAVLFGSFLVIQYVTCRSNPAAGRSGFGAKVGVAKAPKRMPRPSTCAAWQHPSSSAWLQTAPGPQGVSCWSGKVARYTWYRYDYRYVYKYGVILSYTHNHTYIYLMHTFVPPALGWALFHQITAGLMASITVPDCIRLPKSLWLCVPIQDKRVRSLPCDQSLRRNMPEYGYGSTIFTHIFQKFDASYLTCTIK